MRETSETDFKVESPNTDAFHGNDTETEEETIDSSRGTFPETGRLRSRRDAADMSNRGRDSPVRFQPIRDGAQDCLGGKIKMRLTISKLQNPVGIITRGVG